MEHRIELKRRDGHKTRIDILPVFISEIERDKKLVDCLTSNGIFTTDDFLKKVRRKNDIARISNSRRLYKQIIAFYEKIEVRFRTYKSKVEKFLKELNDLNFRMKDGDANYIATSIIFHDILKVDSWEFMMPLLSTKAQEEIQCNEKKWHSIYFSCL